MLVVAICLDLDETALMDFAAEHTVANASLTRLRRWLSWLHHVPPGAGARTGISVDTMSDPASHDPASARFRRGAGRPVGPPGPPPPVAGYGARVQDPGLTPAPWAPESPPITVADLPAPGDPSVPAGAPAPVIAPESRPAFGELVGAPGDDGPWPPRSWSTDDQDPGRTTGVVAIVVGFFVGIVGVFIGIVSLQRSRRVGLAGALGTAGIVVSILNIVVGGAVGISYVRYEVSLAQQCSLVGPGQYLTQSGDQVSCG
jgi:hypothetical protein